jgi:CubicO group peptidase (beta-lactamase class C family)
MTSAMPAVRCAVVRVALCLATVPAAAQSPRAAPPVDSVVAARVDEYLSRLAALGHNGGVLVLRDGRTVLERSYGMANRDAGIRADAATVYNIGSITKQFTAAAILRLEELGKLHTTDSIGRFFRELPVDKRGITIHHLLTHTAGLESDFSPTDYEPTTRDEYVHRALASKLRTPPGTQHYYANSGYSLLAAIVEIVTGRDYEAALTELVLRPAGMSETGYKAPHWDARRVAHGYQDGRDWGTIVERIAAPGAPFWALRGNGGLATTLGDFARWDAAQNDGRVLTDSSRRKFTTPWVNEDASGRSQYAYGWAVMKTPRGTRLVTHNGGNGVYVAEFQRFVDEGVTIFLTSTNAEMKASPMARVVERIVFGEPYELPPAAAAVSAGSLAAVAGTFVLPDGGRLMIRADRGQLLADAIGQSAFALLAAGDTSSSPGAAELNAKVRTIVEALVKSDIRPLVALLADQPDTADVGRQERALLSDRRQRWGELRSVDVLGTVPGAEGGLTTTARLTFERGIATNLYTWGPAGRIVDLGARPYRSTALVAVGEREFQTMQGLGSGTLRLRLDGTGLVAQTPRGNVRLVRVK